MTNMEKFLQFIHATLRRRLVLVSALSDTYMQETD